MDLGLAGRVAVVTGSSQGTGRAAALLLGSEGARVVVTYHRERDRAQAVVGEIGKGGGDAVAVQSKELAPAGILVNVIMPSATRTERMVARLPVQFLERSAQASPRRRLPGPDEVATAIVYLCSGGNTAITGEIVRVGGGAT